MDQLYLRRTNQIPVGLRRLSATKVAKRPRSITEHADLVVFAQEAQQWPQSTLLEDIVPTLRAVARNVTQRPNSLLADIHHRGG